MTIGKIQENIFFLSSLIHKHQFVLLFQPECCGFVYFLRIRIGFCCCKSMIQIRFLLRLGSGQSRPEFATPFRIRIRKPNDLFIESRIRSFQLLLFHSRLISGYDFRHKHCVMKQEQEQEGSSDYTSPPPIQF